MTFRRNHLSAMALVLAAAASLPGVAPARTMTPNRASVRGAGNDYTFPKGKRQAQWKTERGGRR